MVTLFLNESLLQHVPTLLDDEDNKNLEAFPPMEEIKMIIADMDENSTFGPDGFNRCFYTKCWDNIKDDLFEAVLDFFCRF